MTDEILERLRRQLAIEFPGCCHMCSLHDPDFTKAECAALGNLSQYKGCPPQECPLRNIYLETREDQ